MNYDKNVLDFLKKVAEGLPKRDYTASEFEGLLLEKGVKFERTYTPEENPSPRGGRSWLRPSTWNQGKKQVFGISIPGVGEVTTFTSMRIGWPVAVEGEKAVATPAVLIGTYQLDENSSRGVRVDDEVRKLVISFFEKREVDLPEKLVTMPDVSGWCSTWWRCEGCNWGGGESGVKQLTMFRSDAERLMQEMSQEMAQILAEK